MAAATKVLTASLTRFYEVPEHADVLHAIATGRSPVSLRLVEWFVTSEREVDLAYHARLRAYTRRLFDPFRRSDRMVLAYADRSFETTLGQMNFFKWLIEDGLWRRLESERAELTVAMLAAPRGRKPGCSAAHKAPAGPQPPRVNSSQPHTLTFG